MRQSTMGTVRVYTSLYAFPLLAKISHLQSLKVELTFQA